MGRKKIIETEEQRQDRFKSYQLKYYSNPINKQIVYEANQRTQSERFKRWYDKQNNTTVPIIIKSPPSGHYCCNNQIFYNVYLALYEQFKSQQPITFHYQDNEYSQLDWTKEPEMDFESLMDAHAHALRNKYEKLILGWSGGTDSHTIYNVFKRNKIHIDEIYVITYPEPDVIAGPTFDYVDWLMKNHWDPTTKIIPIGTADESRKTILSNEDWIFENRGDFHKFGLSNVDTINLQLAGDNYGAHSWCIIAGYEKPYVYQLGEAWYGAVSGNSLKAVLGKDNIENFFLEPILYLKQCHMAKNILKKLNREDKSLEFGNRFYYGTRRNFSGGYRVWSNSVGRHDELIVGASYPHKILNGKRLSQTQIGISDNLSDFCTPEKRLQELLIAGDVMAVNYTKGLYNLRREKDFFNYLNDNWLNKKNAVLNLKDIYSKSYYLGN